MFTTFVVGTVVWKSAARTAYRNGKATTAVDLQVVAGPDGEEVTVVVWGQAALDCARYLEVGRTVSAQGTARARPGGQYRATLEVHTEHVEVHGRAMGIPPSLGQALNEGDGVYRP